MSTDPRSPDHAEEDEADELDNVVPSRGYQMLPVVGLGGSAGSISALQSFFAGLPADTGMAFVVVLHLSPDHDSALADLLQRETRMKVTQVLETAPMEANRVYVIPPRKGLKTMDGHLRLFDLPNDRTRHVAVDHFFRTLADTHGPHASAVILSGNDGDGAIGIKRIKERGGLTIAQDPGEAEFEGMPRTAIATGMVDWVLPVAEMPGRLIDYHRQEHRVRLPPEDGPPVQIAGSTSDEGTLRDVLNFLRTRTGRDFSYYKRATILRRIGRRMQVNGIDDLSGYLGCLRTRPGEAGALLQDLLISVTNFFRDADCFAALESRIPDLFRDKGPTDIVRVWVVACATGEEAYTVAMLLNEHARTLDAPPVVQVFATDLDEDAIQVAREGIYPSTIEADVSEDRLRRYFIKEHRGYRVRREVREMVLFAMHDLLKDSPFSRLDLVTCRNLLIYLNRDAQARALDIFHFALRPGATLFLGSSESVEDGSPLFTVLDKKHRLFRQRPMPRAGLPVPSGPGTLALALETQQAQGEAAHSAGRVFEQGPANPRLADRAASSRTVPWGEVHLRLLDRLAPPSVLVDAEYEMLHLSPAAGRFLQFNGGEPSRNLLRSVHPALRIELRAALYQVSQSGEPTTVPGLAMPLPEGSLAVTVHVYPARDVSPDLMLVVFQSGVPETPLDAAAEKRPPEPLARQLEREIDRLKSHLRDTVEQYEASTEELKASNEELQAMNEELRSATEELETSREELQSINEELTTVNHELKSKVDELGQANSDMHNLMDATAIATVFLDRQLRITRFTPSAVALFNLIATDIGRPLTDLTTQLRYPSLATDAQNVLETLVSVEREVGQGGDPGAGDLVDAGGHWYLARLRPYRTIDDRIAGVVLTFVDITERKRAQEALSAADARFRAIVDQATVGVLQVDLQGRIALVNGRMCRLLDYAEQELVGMSLDALVHPDDQVQHRQRLQLLLERDESFEIEKRLLRRDGSPVWVHNSVTSLPAMDGGEGSVIAVCVDITERKTAEAALRNSEEHLRMVLENAREYAIFTTDADRRITAWNPGAQRILGYSEQEATGRQADMIFTDEDRGAGVPQEEASQALAEGRAGDDRFHQRKDGSLFWASGAMMTMHDAEGRNAGFVKILRDQSEARRSQQALELSQSELLRALRENEGARAALEAANVAKDQFLAVLSHELRTPLTPAVMALQMLSRREELPEDVHRSLEMILRNIRVESRLIDDLLDLTRISRGTLELDRASVDLHQIIRAACEVCDGDVREKAQVLTVDLRATVHRTVGDNHRLQQVVWNLLKNASKFTPPRGAIRISTTLEEGRFVMTVEDNGVGIEPEALPRIFEAFVQGGTWVAREFGGLGLGLSISKATVEAHGGRLRVSSPGRGQGATFTLELPLAEL
ncbi:PAS domain S-box protein [Mitsuaria sp. GD03876]|uniref:PAS domain S-box protein n=1 Tax=Mitsuaria sp. GD03876 TaxID=2975399 RepID=UPI002446978A|nr:PAS domain S-box protein [Mitsuaria sp. GD03876]MDH0865861.1 PAS domain S-box protein [Mitsuaria sp. GD03876]